MSYQKASGSENGSTDIEDASKRQKTKLFCGIAAVVVIGIVTSLIKNPKSSSTPFTVTSPVIAESEGDVSLGKGGNLKLFDNNNRYVLEDYDSKPTFASFLPGVAGLYGKPVWSFYVNRGQAMASFGLKSKDYPILEFNAANKAYQLTPFIGFRTFIKGTRGGKSFLTEPFTPSKSRSEGEPNMGLPKRIMFVGTNECEIREVDSENGLTTSVKYIVLPEEDFAALVRRTNITNTGSEPMTISVLDGLAKLEPVGGKLDWGLKNMGRTLEGWMGVYQVNSADGPLTQPFYRMSTEASDSASVTIEEGGHYLLSFIEDDENDPVLLPIVYDTECVFGKSTSLLEPNGFKKSSVAEILSGPQYGQARTSSGFAAVEKITLQPGESVSIASFYGKTDHINEVSPIAEYVTKAGYVSKVFQRARSLIDTLTASVETNTTNNLFNGAVKQMFLDNSLRGGMPIVLGDVDMDAKYSNYDEDDRVKVFHAFSRIHGDLERDYNAFFIDDSFYSQGPGNFRDIAQNRRDDVTFTPRIGSFDVKEFLSFIQADAYEPLTVEAVVYYIKDITVAATIAGLCTADPKSSEGLYNVLIGGPFRPGQLFDLIDRLGIVLSVERQFMLDQVVAHSESLAMAVYGSGYWADHWEYYLDLINSYLAIYPDGEEALMYENELRYFFSTATVRARSDKYVLTLTFDGRSKHVLQLDSTAFDQKKVEEQNDYRNAKTGVIGIDAYWQRTPEGGAFKSTPIAKLFLLGAIKYATRDAYGMGIEYEGGRPGWNDAMNGLPGMLGSGMPETFEMYQLLKYVKNVVSKYRRSIVIPSELADLVTTVNSALDDLLSNGYEEPNVYSDDVPDELFTYWDIVSTAREDYRYKVEYYFSGNTTELTADDVVHMLDRWINQVEIGIDRAMKFGSRGFNDDGSSGVPPSYFSYNVTSWEFNDKKNDVGLPLVNAKSMAVGRFPLFLEGPVRYMKTITTDKSAMLDMYNKVKKSGLRDEELKMYHLSASLKGQSYDMGRMMAFAPGWLENESIWMHMSYKYYLELIRGKLYNEFFSEMRGGGMLPFMNPDRYGRSLMECSSFLASSAFPDPSMHGRGFSARLSGSTAEFLSIWKLMFIGPEPFFLSESGSLKMHLKPALPLWLFKDEEEQEEPTYDEDGNLTVSFKLFAHIIVTYHNSRNTDLYDIAPNRYKITMIDGTSKLIDGPTIPPKLATSIRKMFDVVSIDAYF